LFYGVMGLSSKPDSLFLNMTLVRVHSAARGARTAVAVRALRATVTLKLRIARQIWQQKSA
jgi:hypothetical protein